MVCKRVARNTATGYPKHDVYNSQYAGMCQRPDNRYSAGKKSAPYNYGLVSLLFSSFLVVGTWLDLVLGVARPIKRLG